MKLPLIRDPASCEYSLESPHNYTGYSICVITKPIDQLGKGEDRLEFYSSPAPAWASTTAAFSISVKCSIHQKHG